MGGKCYLKDWSVGLAFYEPNLVNRTDTRGLISLVEETNRVGFVVAHDLVELGWADIYLQLTLKIEGKINIVEYLYWSLFLAERQRHHIPHMVEQSYACWVEQIFRPKIVSEL